MSNTLPRTRSMSATSSTSLTSIPRERDRARPVSMCDASYHKVGGTETRLTAMQRSPSQANNLCTTVPTSLVPRTLGGRHTPTRSSLRHSRMVVHGKAQPKIIPNNRARRERRWLAGGVGRVGVLVITAETLVGVMTVTLGVWLLIWTPSIRFTEVPHYSGVPVLLAGVFGAALISCCQSRKYRKSAPIIKGIVVVLCCISILTCMSVIVFTAMHLIYLAPMTCRNHYDVLFQPPSDTYQQPGVQSTPRSGLKHSQRIPKDNKRVIEKMREENFEGSGEFFDDLEIDVDSTDYSELELRQSHLETFPAKINKGISINISVCVCESWDETNSWKRTLRYPDLLCSEVNNVLPILFVASCVLSTVGSILSGMILYLLWTSRTNIYNSPRSSEVRPFIFTSNLKKNPRIENGNNIKNGNGSLYR